MATGIAKRCQVWGVSGLVVALAASLAGCSSGLPSLPSLPKVSELNPFAEKKKPLPGKRVPVLQVRKSGAPGELADAAQPIIVPPPSLNETWTQPGGIASNAPGHLALGTSLTKSWSASAGTGSNSSGRLLASPIVYGSRAYTLDTRGTVSAFALGSGARSWQVSLKPDTENVSGGFFSLGSLTGGDSATGGFGGGIAADEGKIFSATGFGNVSALDAATGKLIWNRRLSSPIRAAPTVVQGRIFIVTIDGQAYCLSTADGTELWAVRGLPQQASLATSVSPAVSNDTVVIPYPSGDIVALSTVDGTTKWSESLSRTRRTTHLASLRNAARPAIADGVVYAVGHGGRLIATKMASGERVWSLRVAGTQTPYVAGQSVFVVDTSGQLLAVSRDQGQVQWTVKLPSSVRTWSGPVLAGGVLWLVSSQGVLAGVEPGSGKVIKQVNIGDDVFIPPIVAQNRLLVLTDEAKLVAFN